MKHKSVAPFSVAILAGGQSRRMGQNKALLNLGGRPVLQWVIDAVKELSSDLFLVTNSPEAYKAFNIPSIPDIRPGKAALGGIYTALTRARYNWVLVLACDMPLLDPKVISFMAEQLQEVDVLIPLVAERPETLHAFYHKNCLPVIERRIKADRLRVIEFFDEVKAHYVDKTALQTVTSDFDFLINLNTPADFQSAKKIIED